MCVVHSIWISHVLYKSYIVYNTHSWIRHVCISQILHIIHTFDIVHTKMKFRLIASPSATHCNTLQHTATDCNTLQHTATHCNTLQYTAAHCNTLQHAATPCSCIEQHKRNYCRKHQRWRNICNTLQHTATHCNTLQHTATYCNTLQIYQAAQERLLSETSALTQFLEEHDHRIHTLQVYFCIIHRYLWYVNVSVCMLHIYSVCLCVYCIYTLYIYSIIHREHIQKQEYILYRL